MLKVCPIEIAFFKQSLVPMALEIFQIELRGFLKSTAVKKKMVFFYLWNLECPMHH